MLVAARVQLLENHHLQDFVGWHRRRGQGVEALLKTRAQQVAEALSGELCWLRLGRIGGVWKLAGAHSLLHLSRRQLARVRRSVARVPGSCGRSSRTALVTWRWQQARSAGGSSVSPAPVAPVGPLAAAGRFRVAAAINSKELRRRVWT